MEYHQLIMRALIVLLTKVLLCGMSKLLPKLSNLANPFGIKKVIQIMNKLQFLPLLLSLIISCAVTPKVDIVPSVNKSLLPRSVIEFFENSPLSVHPDLQQFQNLNPPDSIVNNKDSEYYMPRAGHIISKKYKWEINIQFTPYLLYKNKKYLIVEAGPDIDSINVFHAHYVLDLVIDAKTGKIFKYLKTRNGISKIMLFNNILYFTFYETNDIYLIHLES